MRKMFIHKSSESSEIEKYLILPKRIINLEPGTDFGKSNLRERLMNSHKLVINFNFNKIGDSLLSLLSTKAFIDFTILKKNYSEKKKSI
jgi:hypothetical protein